MSNWLKRNEILEKLSKRDMENFYSTVMELKEDLEFFELYIKRNKKSSFNFKISFTKGLADSFLTYLYTKSYCYKTSELEALYAEYLLVEHFFKTLSDEEDEIIYSEEDLKAIYNHFLYLHEIKLEDYVSSFIGCSRGCMDIVDKIHKLLEGSTNE